MRKTIYDEDAHGEAATDTVKLATAEQSLVPFLSVQMPSRVWDPWDASL